MEEDTEVIDWGAHEEEHQTTLGRDAAHTQQQRNNYYTEEEDDDAVSLGEEEDDQAYFFQHQSAHRSIYNTGISSQNQEAPEESPPPPSREDDTGANSQQTQISQQTFEDDDRSGSLHARTTSTESPPRTSSSRNRHSSPQRSSNSNNHNGTRLTHALPPKPVTVPSAYLPHSLSMVEAIGMAAVSPGRTSARDRDRDVAKKANGPPPPKSGPGSSPVTADLPQNWEKRHSRSNGDLYYYNSETHESTRTLPSSASSQNRRRRHSRSPGPISSDVHHSQTARSARDLERAHDRDREVEGSTRSATPDLSFKDRHYRPADGGAEVSVEVRTVEHTEVISARVPAKSRYDRSPSPLPSRRRRPRSLSPQPDAKGAQVSSARDRDRDRDHRSSATAVAVRDAGRPADRDRDARDRDRQREKNYTNSDSSMSRDLEPPEPGYSDRHWVAPPRLPAADFSKTTEQRSLRRDEVLVVDQRVSASDNRERDNRNNRPSLRHRESSRGPTRDRERDREPARQPPPDRRERANEQQFISTQRYRSPPPQTRARDRDQGRDYPSTQQEIEPPAAPSNRRDRDRDRSSRFEPSSSSSSVARQSQVQPQPQTREGVADVARPRERDYEPQGPPPPANYDSARRDRDRDRDRRPDDRGRDYADRHPHRRDTVLDDNNDLPRRPEVYPAHAGMGRPATANERPPPKRYNEDRDRYDQQQPLPLPDESLHRRRAPLPPQTKSFLSSSNSGPIHRDPPPHTAPEWAQVLKDPPPHRPPPDDRPPVPRRGRGEWPPHPPPPPPSQGPPPPRVDTRMEVDYYPDVPRSAVHPHTSPYDKPRNVERPPPPQFRESYEPTEGPRPNRPSLPSRPSANSATALPPAGPTLRRGPEHGPPSGPSASGPPPSKYDDRRGGQDGYGPQQDGRPGSGWRESRPPSTYPERNPPPRRDYRDRPEDKVRPPPRGPPPPVTGTNNVPIGPRRAGAQGSPLLPPPPPPPAANLPPPAAFPHGMPPGPPPIGVPFNPDARPPPSTLIDPSKARDLPPGKESYERPPNLQISSVPLPRGPKSSIENPSRRDLHPHIPDDSQQSLQVPPGADRPGRRRDGRGSRFSPIETKARPEQPTQPIPERLPVPDFSTSNLPLAQPTNEDENIDIIERPPTPPPVSREPSLSITMDQTSSRVSEQGQSSDARSDTSRSAVSGLSEQRPDAPQRAGPGPESTAPPPSKPVQEQESPSSKAAQQQPARTFTRWGGKPAPPPTAPGPTGGSLTVEMVDTSEPALSRRLSDGYSERPPRHRKHPSDKDLGDPGSADNVYPPPLPSSRTRPQVDNRSGFMDRLEASAPPGGNPPISLLARLSAQPLPDQDVPPQSLRDRLVPSKRDRDDMMMDERGGHRDGPYDGDDGNENKRAKRRNGRGRGRGGMRRSMT